MGSRLATPFLPLLPVQVEAELARTYADEKAVADELELLVGRRVGVLDVG